MLPCVCLAVMCTLIQAHSDKAPFPLPISVTLCIRFRAHKNTHTHSHKHANIHPLLQNQLQNIDFSDCSMAYEKHFSFVWLLLLLPSYRFYAAVCYLISLRECVCVRVTIFVSILSERRATNNNKAGATSNKRMTEPKQIKYSPKIAFQMISTSSNKKQQHNNQRMVVTSISLHSHIYIALNA